MQTDFQGNANQQKTANNSDQKPTPPRWWWISLWLNGLINQVLTGGPTQHLWLKFPGDVFSDGPGASRVQCATHPRSSRFQESPPVICKDVVSTDRVVVWYIQSQYPPVPRMANWWFGVRKPLSVWGYVWTALKTSRREWKKLGGSLQIQASMVILIRQANKLPEPQSTAEEVPLPIANQWPTSGLGSPGSLLLPLTRRIPDILAPDRDMSQYPAGWYISRLVRTKLTDDVLPRSTVINPSPTNPHKA